VLDFHQARPAIAIAAVEGDRKLVLLGESQEGSAIAGDGI
jgi:hypothetical protein